MSSPSETTLPALSMCGLGEMRIAHPAGTFALTPASLITLQAIATHQHLLAGMGLDWGSGAGCLAIAAARIAAVKRVIGLEISQRNVAIARQNALSNYVEGKTDFLVADSYSPISSADSLALSVFLEQTDFILANPPTSEGDDGFGYRRLVLRGARPYLAVGGIVFLSVSSQYGQVRVERLCEEVPGFRYMGILSSTDWVPFDLGRADLLQCLRLYAVEEARGGLEYSFRRPAGPGDEKTTARSALARFHETGEYPLMKWQTHLFEWQGAGHVTDI